MWLGNMFGCLWGAIILRSIANETVILAAEQMVATKLTIPYFQLFCLGIFCGILMYIAVKGYKDTKNPLIIIMCVATFILCKFEHCIADMFYCFFVYQYPFGLLLAVTAGNTIGALIIPTLKGENYEKK